MISLIRDQDTPANYLTSVKLPSYEESPSLANYLLFFAFVKLPACAESPPQANYLSWLLLNCFLEKKQNQKTQQQQQPPHAASKQDTRMWVFCL